MDIFGSLFTPHQYHPQLLREQHPKPCSVTVEFDGGTVYTVSGFPSPEAALWAAFRGIALTYRMRGEHWRKARKTARRAFSRKQVVQLDRIAKGKLNPSPPSAT